MNAITESNAEMFSAPGETGGKSLVVLPPDVMPPDSRAATPATPPADSSPDAAPENGDAQSAPAQLSPLAGEAGGEIAVRTSSVAVAPPDAALDPLEDALAALDRRDYATAQRLFEALGRKGAAAGIEDALAALDRKDYASAHRLFEALGQVGSAGGSVKVSLPAIPVPLKPTPSAPAATADAAQAAPPLEVIPRVDAAFRRPSPPAKKATRRGLSPALLCTGLVLIIAAGGSVFFSPQIKSAFAHFGGPLKATLALAKSETAAGLASAAGVLKAPLEAVTGAGAREDERAAERDLGAALTQVTIRLDQIERDYAARLDKLGERVDQDSSYRVPDIVQRLDRLEQKAAAPAAPISEFADLVARLDKVEKRAAAAQPASEFAEITARLDKVERKAAIAVAPSELTAVTTRLDRLEKRLSGAAANSPLAVPPAGPRPAALLARAEPTPPSDGAKPAENQKPLLRNFSIEDVRDGLAVVETREGPQQVGPGDLIPGAGRVLRIERRDGEWFVVTSLGVIASDPSSY